MKKKKQQKQKKIKNKVLNKLNFNDLPLKNLSMFMIKTFQKN